VTGLVFVGSASLAGWLLGQLGLTFRNRVAQKLA
jgi:hypothetical protein